LSNRKVSRNINNVRVRWTCMVSGDGHTSFLIDLHGALSSLGDVFVCFYLICLYYLSSHANFLPISAVMVSLSLSEPTLSSCAWKSMPQIPPYLPTALVWPPLTLLASCLLWSSFPRCRPRPTTALHLSSQFGPKTWFTTDTRFVFLVARPDIP
jgi:hypothetical protein